MTGLEEDQEFDFDFLFEFNQSDEGTAAAPGGSARGLGRGRGHGRGVQGRRVAMFQGAGPEGARPPGCRTPRVQGPGRAGPWGRRWCGIWRCRAQGVQRRNPGSDLQDQGVQGRGGCLGLGCRVQSCRPPPLQGGAGVWAWGYRNQAGVAWGGCPAPRALGDLLRGIECNGEL